MKTILFVDDHEMLAQLSCEILEMHGYRAISANSGAEALAKFDQDKFDAVVTDLRMDGMDGLELATLIHHRQPDLPVILITGYDPISGHKDIVVCLQKRDLFPSLIEQLKLCIGESEATECRLKSA